MYKKTTTTTIHSMHMYICVRALVCMCVSLCVCKIYGNKKCRFTNKIAIWKFECFNYYKKIIMNAREKPMQGHFSRTAADDLFVGILSTPLIEM